MATFILLIPGADDLNSLKAYGLELVSITRRAVGLVELIVDGDADAVGQFAADFEVEPVGFD
jgi:hypothetical protein